jgi:hypothetical protein
MECTTDLTTIGHAPVVNHVAASILGLEKEIIAAVNNTTLTMIAITYLG